jgi:hypothetical protein
MFKLLISAVNIITLLSLNIYKHICDKYKQTNNCVHEKKDKYNELFMLQ